MKRDIYLKLLSRQTESVRDHKFHSGYVIHRWLIQLGGTLFRTCIKLKSKQRDSGASQSPCFSQMRSEMRLCLFLQKEMTWRSAHFSNFESRLYVPLCFQPIFSQLLAGTDLRFNDMDFPRFSCYYQKLFWLLFCSLIAFNILNNLI